MLTYIPDIAEEHYEELQFLWGLRQQMLRSPWQYLRDLHAFEQRIEAHVQGLLIAGGDLEAVVGEVNTFAAAYALLRSPKPASHVKVLEAFAKARPPALDGLKQALSHAPATDVLRDVHGLLEGALPHVAVAAAEILAFHGAHDPAGLRIDHFVKDPDARVREAGWRIAGLLGARLDAKSYAGGLRDEDTAAKREAMYAAAWAQQQGVLVFCRDAGTIDALRLVAILGDATDLPRMLASEKAADLGPARYALLGSFGHPAVVPVLLTAMTSDDTATAVAAAAAFTNITGVDIRSQHTGEVPLDPKPDGAAPDAFEAEFTAPVVLPDVAKAIEHWRSIEPRMSATTRLCHGFDLSDPRTPAPLDSFTTEARWEGCLRAKFRGAWLGHAIRLERLHT